MQIKVFKKYKLPDSPGVYFFKKGSRILYIGKATSLKDRVKSYFGKDLGNTRSPLIVDMLEKASSIKWQETDSVLEALILEANLIKKYQPYFNTKEKDDKSFNYVCITNELLPRVLVVRGKDLESSAKQGFSRSSGRSHSLLVEERAQPDTRKSLFRFAKTFGPFPYGSQLREALKIIRNIFPFLDEKSKTSYEFYKQLKLAPDIENRDEYLKNIKNIKLFFEGKKKKILKNLEKEMKKYAKMHEFENAIELKRQIFALKHIQDVSLIKKDLSESRTSDVGSRIEAYDIAHMNGGNMVGAMTVVTSGEPNKKEYRKFKIKNYTKSNDTGALEEILTRRFNHPEWPMPNLIVVDGGLAQMNVARSVLRRLKLSIPIVSVIKDEKHKPKMIKGDHDLILKYKDEILLANNEAHRFSIGFHKQQRTKNFLK